jgi:hypothetical protein
MNTPVVHMNKVFEIWLQTNFSLNNTERFYFNHLKIMIETETNLIAKIKELNGNTYKKIIKNKMILKLASKKTTVQRAENKIFQLLCKFDNETYLNCPNVRNIKKCFIETQHMVC